MARCMLIVYQDLLPLFGERNSRLTPFAENTLALLVDGFMLLASLRPATFLHLLVSGVR